MTTGRLTVLMALGGLAGCYQMGPGAHREALLEEQGDDGGACVSSKTTIFAGQHIESGALTVGSDGEDLIFDIRGDNGWMITEVHVYVGAGVPSRVPGKYPYKEELDAPVGQYTLRVPLAAVDAGCGDALNIAVHTVMVLIEDGAVVDTQTGWGFGPNEFQRAWGWWFTTDVCCEVPGCVRSKGPWRESPAAWPIDSLEVGGTEYDAPALFDILWTSPAVGVSVDLAHQTIAARLNEASGAFVDAQTAADLAAADALLEGAADADGLPFPVDAATAAAMQAARDALFQYNMGNRETPTCDPEWLAPSCWPVNEYCL